MQSYGIWVGGGFLLMKIITWNVNGIRSVMRKGFLSFVQEHNPDILCIQESKAHPDAVSEFESFNKHNLQSRDNNGNEVAAKATPSGGAAKVSLATRGHNLQSSDNNVSEVAVKATPSGGAAKVSPATRGRRSNPLRGYWSFADRKGYSGVVTFVKGGIKGVSYGIGIRKFDDEGRFVITDHGNFVLFNIYFPNGSQREERHLFKQEFLERLLQYIKRQLAMGKELIVVGDYNTAYLDIDVFDPVLLKSASGFLPEERRWFQKFLDLGFVDCYRHFHLKEKEKYTWWSYRENARLRNRGWRIDHICVSAGLRDRLHSADILSDQLGSDHCPVQLCLGE